MVNGAEIKSEPVNKATDDNSLPWQIMKHSYIEWQTALKVSEILFTRHCNTAVLPIAKAGATSCQWEQANASEIN